MAEGSALPGGQDGSRRNRRYTAEQRRPIVHPRIVRLVIATAVGALAGQWIGQALACDCGLTINGELWILGEGRSTTRQVAAVVNGGILEAIDTNGSLQLSTGLGHVRLHPQ